MEQLISRVGQIEQRVWKHDDILSDHGARLASLETSRDNDNARHTKTPQVIYWIIAGSISGISVLLQLWAMGGKVTP